MQLQNISHMNAGMMMLKIFTILLELEKYGGVGESPCVSCKIVQYIGNPECTSCMRVREWIDLRDRSDKLIKAHLQSIGIVGD